MGVVGCIGEEGFDEGAQEGGLSHILPEAPSAHHCVHSHYPLHVTFPNTLKIKAECYSKLNIKNFK